MTLEKIRNMMSGNYNSYERNLRILRVGSCAKQAQVRKGEPLPREEGEGAGEGEGEGEGEDKGNRK